MYEEHTAENTMAGYKIKPGVSSTLGAGELKESEHK